MAWDDDMTAVVRTLLQDVGTTQVYQDDGIVSVVLISGMQMSMKFIGRFANTYAISIANQTLRPDPTVAATKDDAFMLLTCYTAVVTLLKSEIRQMTRQGISIQDGDSKVSLQRDSAALALMLTSYEDTLADLLYDFQTNGGQGLGQVVVSPYPYFPSPEYGHHDRNGHHVPGGYF